MRLGKQRGPSITLFYKMPPRPPHYCYNALTFFRHGIMSGDITLLTLFLIGFFGGGHCVGMCGGLSSAFALQLPPHIKRFWLIVLLNAGRISSYITIGVLLGMLGQIGISLDQTRWLRKRFVCGGQCVAAFFGALSGRSLHPCHQSGKLGAAGVAALKPAFGQAFADTVGARLLRRRAYCGAGCPAAWFTALRFMHSAAAAPRKAAFICWLLRWALCPIYWRWAFFAGQLKSFLQHRSIRLAAGLLVAGWRCGNRCRFVRHTF